MPLAQTLIDDCFYELNIYAESATPSSADRNRGLRILNRDIMNPWSVRALFATTRTLTTATWASSQATRTVGPSGTFNLAVRPSVILEAHRIDANDLAYPLSVETESDYAALGDPTFEGSEITRLFYFPTVPTGTLRAWPVPSANNSIRILTRSFVAEFADLASTSLDLPPAYEHAICETLKELFCRAWHRDKPDGLTESARQARAEIQITNASLRRRRLVNDAPSLVHPVSSDPDQFRTRSF